MRSDDDPWADDLDETDDPIDADMDDSEDAEDDDEEDSSPARKPLWIWIAAGLGVIVILTWILGHGPF